MVPPDRFEACWAAQPVGSRGPGKVRRASKRHVVNERTQDGRKCGPHAYMM